MRGNSHVRFLGEGLAVMPSSYPIVITNFYPRSPCGERQYWATRARDAQRFLSTLSLRRATAVGKLVAKHIRISIHALLAESDWLALSPVRPFSAYFYPRSPCGERPVNVYAAAGQDVFLSTLSLRRATAAEKGAA